MGKLRNEEMETLVRAEPWVILHWQKSTGKAGGLVSEKKSGLGD